MVADRETISSETATGVRKDSLDTTRRGGKGSFESTHEREAISPIYNSTSGFPKQGKKNINEKKCTIDVTI